LSPGIKTTAAPAPIRSRIESQLMVGAVRSPRKRAQHQQRHGADGEHQLRQERQ